MRAAVFLTSLVVGTAGLIPQSQAATSFGIYAYDSLLASGGLGDFVFRQFRTKNPQCDPRPLASGDAGQLVSRIELDARRGKFPAQVAVGVDQHLWPQLKHFVARWNAEGIDQVDSRFLIDGRGSGFVPFDFGVFSLIVDRQQLKPGQSPPESLSALLSSHWKRSLILQDPRTSTPGLAFLLYTRAALKQESWHYWKRLKSQWLTLAPGWDGAYSLFLKRQAPLVWSYTSSQAYHRMHHPEGDRYRAVLFQEGNPAQVEGAVLLRDSFKTPEQRQCAEAFVSFLISQEVQKEIPTRNWMLPVRKGVVLPKAFAELPVPKKLWLLNRSSRDTPIQSLLTRWLKALYDLEVPMSPDRREGERS